MMIHIEDSSFQIQNKFDCIIPFEIHVFKDETIINVYDIVQDVVDKYLKLFYDPFSFKALDYLYENIDPIIRELGYESHLQDISYYYEIDCVNTDFILPNTIKWNKSIKCENLTSIDLNYIDDRNIFVTLIDNKIVSYACENPHESDDVRNIGVETNPNYTGNGYATSNAAALTLYNLNLNKKVIYICDKSNYTSQSIANKVGFTKTGNEYHYVCYRR